MSSTSHVGCRKCNVKEQSNAGEVFLTPVAEHRPGCPNDTTEEKGTFAFVSVSCIECRNQQDWLEKYEAWKGNNSLEFPCPGAPRYHTCFRGN